MTSYSIGSEHLSLSVLQHIIADDLTLSLSEDAERAINNCRKYLNRKISDTSSPIYGINTGFGYLQNVIIPNEQLSQLQHNLLLSHACGTGDFVPAEIIKLMLLLKIQSLAFGNSGINLSTVERLVFMYNNNVLPVIYTQGSLGASG
ncbi:MAG: aromatic amino acid lyase, partial [Daejeonella sp.]